MSTPAKPHNGHRPICSSCLKRGEACFFERDYEAQYPGGAFTPGVLADVVADVPHHQSWDAWPTGDFHDPNIPSQPGSILNEMSIGSTYEWITSSNGSFASPFQGPTTVLHNLPTPQGSNSPMTPVSLPSENMQLEMIDLFFEKFYQYMPVIHKPTLLSNIKSNGVEGVSPALLLAIMAVSAGAHPDDQIRQSQLSWFEEARARVIKDMPSPDNALQTLQAAVLTIYQAMIVTDYSGTLLMLGEAWRKAVAIGCVRDAKKKHRTMPALGSCLTGNWIVMEESKRVAWMLFILDRGMCFPIGLAHAIDDRQLKIDLPMAEESFQSMEEPLEGVGIRYVQDLDGFVTAIQEQSRRGRTSLFQYLILAYSLLGQISAAIDYADCDDDDDDDDDEQRKSVLKTLGSRLVRIRLMLPRSATELCAAQRHDFSYVFWLNAVMSTCTILLHHRPVPEHITSERTSEMEVHWPYCVAAARGIVAAIRDASRASVDYVNNAHLASLLFTASRILIIEYYSTSSSLSPSSAAQTRPSSGLSPSSPPHPHQQQHPRPRTTR
ncbi:Squalestatin S1 biosynthesis transcriptional activator L3-like protein [Cladobotryum mycophilum]|uniref:Squalestatin S1 biosynthesis transcriptional activator L3-like protein n=1 Tax=Cladobotryum mycophilum TaxID=491253 RepID=A0ABR0SV90_9HYPO